MQEFKVDFVKRSLDILNQYEGEYPFSNLINCTLGLVLLPFEKGDNVEVWGKLISDVEVLKDVQINIFEPKLFNIIQPKSLNNFLKRMRHGFAHQNIIPINENKEFVKIQIINEYRKVIDLDVTFTREQLRDFALFIANTYLKSHDLKEKLLTLAKDSPKVETVN
ncbi:MAG: hypothetical protein IH620_05670 [Ignavibacterium sp.]|nr:hypothetical protein [Ignavibacterium sp.]